MGMQNDFTTNGTKLEGQWENDRNADSRGIITRCLREVYGNDVQTIIAHHLCYQIQEGDKFIVQEIPSMDAFLFDHTIGRALFGEGFKEVLAKLARLPAPDRDKAFAAELGNR